MLRLERYEIDQSPEQIIIRLEQRKNALVNIVISLGVIILAVCCCLHQEIHPPFIMCFSGWACSG